MDESLHTKPKKALIDADWLVYSVGFASEDDDVDDAKRRVTEMVTDIVYFRLDCEDYEAYLTGKDNFRFNVATTIPYKDNRKDAKKPKHYDALREHLQRLGASIVDGIEADDKVAMRMFECPGEFILVGVDKDLNQIEGWHYNPKHDEEYFINEHKAWYNFFTQMLTGDRVDNIPGLPGIGPKKAEKILSECITHEDMYKATKDAYYAKDFTDDYFNEQARLLWLQRTPTDYSGYLNGT